MDEDHSNPGSRELETAVRPSFISNYWNKQDRYNRWLHIIIFLGFVIRLIFSLNAWGLKHPDEIFQSIEISHYLVYGSGHIAPEFQSSNHDIESYSASRSWIFPIIFAFIMRLGEFLGLDYFRGTLVLIRIFLALNATLLIPAIYKLTAYYTKDRLVGIYAAVYVAFWFRIIEFTIRPFTNTFFLPYIFFGIYRVLVSIDGDIKLTNVIEIGFLLGLSTYIRFDLGIIVFGFFVGTYRMKEKKDTDLNGTYAIINNYIQRIIRSPKLHHYLLYALSGLLFWLWGAWIDYQRYETAPFFSVPINFLKFNIFEGHSAIFGVSGPFYYIVILLLRDGLFIWFIIILGWIFWYYWKKPSSSVLNGELGLKFRKLAGITLIIWTIYSNPLISGLGWGKYAVGVFFQESHKEERFLIGGLVVFLMLYAVATKLLILVLSAKWHYIENISAELKDTISSKIGNPKDKFVKTGSWFSHFNNRTRKVTVLVILLFFMQTMYGFGFAMYPDYNEGITKSLIHIGQQGDAEDILVAEHWFRTGYRTYSHTNSSVEFYFYPFFDQNYGSFYMNNTLRLISDRSPHFYMVIPEYAYSYLPTLVETFNYYNWSNVFSSQNTDVWNYVSTIE